MLEFSSRCPSHSTYSPFQWDRIKIVQGRGLGFFCLFVLLIFFYRSDWKHTGKIQKGITFLWRKSLVWPNYFRTPQETWKYRISVLSSQHEDRNPGQTILYIQVSTPKHPFNYMRNCSSIKLEGLSSRTGICDQANKAAAHLQNLLSTFAALLFLPTGV